MCQIDDTSKTYGHPPEIWEAAKNKIRAALWEAARQQTWLTYSDAVAEIREFIVFDPHDTVFHQMLGQMSALVVHKFGDGQPGPGFYDLARRLGRKVQDPTRCWVEEINRLFEEANAVRA